MNLLIDPLLRVQTKQDLEYLSLPALFAALGKNEVRHLVGIQRHQHDAFHVFLCYLAGAVLARDHSSNPVRREDFWREGLLRLSGNAGYDAWQVVVEDVSRPAFMQPPLPEGNRKPTSVMNTPPDELDVLQTAKNHDVKRQRATSAEVDTWLYALISLQTMSGYCGSGNHGISRMNSGAGNRSVVEVMRDRTPGQRWIDAVTRLLDHRRHVLEGPFGYDPEGLVLVWLEPWDGNTHWNWPRLDPFYIEICRRIRLHGGRTIDCAEFHTSRQPPYRGERAERCCWRPMVAC